MELKVINQEFSVCKIRDMAQVDIRDPYFFIGKTDEELSLVCGTEYVPEDTLACEHGWKAFRIQGVLDFSLVGILSKISSTLADNQIGLFAVSTFNTDYILVKKADLGRTLDVLAQTDYVTDVYIDRCNES